MDPSRLNKHNHVEQLFIPNFISNYFLPVQSNLSVVQSRHLFLLSILYLTSDLHTGDRAGQPASVDTHSCKRGIHKGSILMGHIQNSTISFH